MPGQNLDVTLLALADPTRRRVIELLRRKPQRAGDLAARGNFCTVDARGAITDRRAGRIATDVCVRLCERLRTIRLDGVQLAARTAQHELNNQLAVARGYAELLAGAHDLPPHLIDMAEAVKHATDDAVNVVRQLRGVAHIHEQHGPGPDNTTIDLARSQDTSRRA